MKAAHHLHIQGLERVAGGLDEVDTRVHSVVHNVHPVDLVLGVQVGVESLLDVLDDGSPRVIVIHKVAKARRVDHRQTQAHPVLLNIRADGLYADGLGREVKGRLLALPGWVQRGVEQGVDEGRFAEAGFTCRAALVLEHCACGVVRSKLTNDHNVEIEALADALAMPLVGQVGEADVASEFSTHNIPHVTGCLRGRLGVFRGHRLGGR